MDAGLIVVAVLIALLAVLLVALFRPHKARRQEIQVIQVITRASPHWREPGPPAPDVQEPTP